MTLNLQEARYSWSEVDKTLNRWLKDRQTLLVSFCELFGTPPFQTKTVEPTDIEHYCQQLVDYISAGHFQIYECLVNEDSQSENRGLALLYKFYPKLINTTQIALAFNDKYATQEDCRRLAQQFHADLSEVGEALAERIDIEDMLIKALHKPQQQATSYWEEAPAVTEDFRDAN